MRGIMGGWWSRVEGGGIKNRPPPSQTYMEYRKNAIRVVVVVYLQVPAYSIRSPEIALYSQFFLFFY
jgi:hypothetical protein